MLDFIKFLFEDFGENWRKYLKQIRNYLIAFVINYLIVYFVATEQTGFCFLLAMIMTQAYSSVSLSVQEVFKALIPIHQSLDDSINGLHSSVTTHEEQIEELEKRIRELEDKIDDLQR
jgi:TolA-binding protein